MNVFLVGNFSIDTYLEIDPLREKLETDQHGTKWLNLAFDNRNLNYFNRSVIHSNLFITKEILTKFNLTPTHPEISHDSPSLVHRYVLNDGDSAAHIEPTSYPETIFIEPKETPDWIFVDRSSRLRQNEIAKIITYLDKNPTIKLALTITKFNPEKLLDDLIKRSSYNFYLNIEPKSQSEHNFYLKKYSLKNQNLELTINSNKTNLLTCSSLEAIISTTLFSGLLQNKSINEALLLAKLNAEESSLASSLSLASLESLAQSQIHIIKPLPKPLENPMAETVKKLFEAKKGILAADESGGSIHKKFEQRNIPDDETHRRDYRNIFFSTDGIKKYLSGVILFEETVDQLSDDGQPFPDYLAERNILSGVKLDEGLVEFLGEKYAKGLENLEEKLKEYSQKNIRFAKWRVAFEVKYNSPSTFAIQKNCEILAKYASLCQRYNIVPIVEPELVFDGNYSLDESKNLTEKILEELFNELEKHSVNLEFTILKTNMVIAGKQYRIQSTPEEVGKATAKVLDSTVPKNLAGIVFLSGGQTVEQSTENLKEIIKSARELDFQTPLTFSFARALQDPVIETWNNDPKNIPAAQEAFLKRLVANTEIL